MNTSAPTVVRGGFDVAAEVVVEVLHGEGGNDAKAFAGELTDMYQRYAAGLGLQTEVLDDDPGHHVLRVTGRGAGRAFAGEAGKHCVQRVSGSGAKAKRHTSFATVAVLPLPPARQYRPLPDAELEVKTQTGRQKAGGQNANKVASAVRMKHTPTGLCVFINGRDQKANRETALRLLTAKVNDQKSQQETEAYVRGKAEQLGDRGRGGKVRTYSFIDNFVLDHRTGRRTDDLKGVFKGRLELLR